MICISGFSTTNLYFQSYRLKAASHFSLPATYRKKLPPDRYSAHLPI
ncbi:MAG TPA: hypothetical protein VM802_13215 [Chitinophaga sp.]|nr:hypothetical protein [Chitinophaga sp.]HVI45827.1 hypothetical protein [Chitinophaga sp.]